MLKEYINAFLKMHRIRASVDDVMQTVMAEARKQYGDHPVIDEGELDRLILRAPSIMIEKGGHNETIY